MAQDGHWQNTNQMPAEFYGGDTPNYTFVPEYQYEDNGGQYNNPVQYINGRHQYEETRAHVRDPAWHQQAGQHQAAQTNQHPEHNPNQHAPHFNGSAGTHPENQHQSHAPPHPQNSLRSDGSFTREEMFNMGMLNRHPGPAPAVRQNQYGGYNGHMVYYDAPPRMQHPPPFAEAQPTQERPPPPPPPEPEPAPSEPPTTKKTTKGKGTRTGQKNRKKAGDSDTEISKLPAEVKAKAALKTDKPDNKKPLGIPVLADQLLIIAYITQNKEFYEKKFKIAKNKIYIFIAQDKEQLNGRYTPEQVQNFWNNNAWARYKACRARDQHTGGEDGDNDLYHDLNAAKEAEKAANEAEGIVEAETAAVGEDGKPLKSTSAYIPGKFTNEALDIFQAGKIYAMIDEVAWDDEIIEPILRCNSSKSCLSEAEEDKPKSKKRRSDAKNSPRKKGRTGKSEDESGSDIEDSMIRTALEAVNNRSKVQAEQFKLDKERAKAEEQERQERLEMDRKRFYDESVEKALMMYGNKENFLARALGKKKLIQLGIDIDELDAEVAAEMAAATANK